MKINLKVVGSALYETILAEKDVLDEAFLKLSKNREPFEWRLTRLDDDFSVEELVNISDSPSAILISSEDGESIEKIHTIEKRGVLSMKEPPSSPVVLSPIIMVFDSEKPLTDVLEFPELVSDWVFAPVLVAELVRRVFSSLKRKQILKPRLKFGALTLLPEARQMSYYGRTMHLTPSEYALAELFLNQTGSVIPIKDLVYLFKSTGKSAEGSNIRVTIFQLRLKLEMLTKSQFTVTSVYKQGYCLRQKPQVASGFGNPNSVSMQRAEYQVFI